MEWYKLTSGLWTPSYSLAVRGRKGAGNDSRTLPISAQNAEGTQQLPPHKPSSLSLSRPYCSPGRRLREVGQRSYCSIGHSQRAG